MREEAKKWLNSYLSGRFVADPGSLPDDECLSESENILSYFESQGVVFDPPEAMVEAAKVIVEDIWTQGYQNHIDNLKTGKAGVLPRVILEKLAFQIVALGESKVDGELLTDDEILWIKAKVGTFISTRMPLMASEFICYDKALLDAQAAKSARYWQAKLEQQARGIKEGLDKIAQLEQCDRDTMPYFSDYYGIDKDEWQEFWKQHIEEKP